MSQLRTALQRAGESPLHPERLESLRRLGELAGRSLLREVVDLYLEEMPLRLERLREALHQSDGPALTLAAHSLKGSSDQIGAVRMAALSAALEQRGVSDDLASAAPLLAELAAEAARVTPLLRHQAEIVAPPRGTV
jgi:HPt (histidine-containing phosphotransfer) domain-containing protein